MQRWYPSKVDGWLAVILVLAPLSSIGGLVIAISAGHGIATAALGVAVFAAIYGGLVFPMRYRIDHRHVIVRHGLITRRVALRDITEVYETHNPLSSPALSLDRIRISAGGGWFGGIMISPAAKAEFLAELARRANLRRAGDRWIR